MALVQRTSKLSIGLLWLVGSFLFALTASAQESESKILKYYRISELGIGIGGINYQGDMSANYRFSNNGLGATIFYRKVVSQPLTLKASFTGGSFHVDDADYTQQPFQIYRDAEIKSRLFELGVGIEYYFLDHYDFKRHSRISPYFFTGPAFMHYRTKREGGLPNGGDETKTEKGIRLAFTMGAGVKVAVSRHWNIGAEFGPRLVMQKDYLDNLTEVTDEGQQLSNPHDRDWYFYNGLFVSYTFYKSYCPSPYKNNMGILR